MQKARSFVILGQKPAAGETRDWLEDLFTKAICERDTLNPTIPGTTLDVDSEKLAKFRAPCQFVASDINLGDRSMTPDLYGDDQPARVDALYKTAFDWLGPSPISLLDK